jgi:hypothetical protein
MNSIAEIILKERERRWLEFESNLLRIRLNTGLYTALKKEKDDKGVYFSRIDPFARHNSTLFGMTIAVDDSVPNWIIERRDA